MNCVACKKDVRDILKHLRKSPNCESKYDVEDIVLQRKLKRLETKRVQSKELYESDKSKKREYYEVNKVNIKKKHSEYKNKNRYRIAIKNAAYKKDNQSKIKERKVVYYKRNRNLISQKKKVLQSFRRKGCFEVCNITSRTPL